MNIGSAVISSCKIPVFWNFCCEIAWRLEGDKPWLKTRRAGFLRRRFAEMLGRAGWNIDVGIWSVDCWADTKKDYRLRYALIWSSGSPNNFRILCYVPIFEHPHCFFSFWSFRCWRLSFGNPEVSKALGFACGSTQPTRTRIKLTPLVKYHANEQITVLPQPFE